MIAERANKHEIFNAAAELVDDAERRVFLDKACGGDAQLRKEIENLLQRDQEAGSFLESPPPGLSVTIGQPSLEKPGTLIGPYKLLQQIGEGGFGVVFMAEQTEPVRRKVALKVLKPGMDTGQVVARFEAERQALAIMDHPNIARVFDGGATATGRPFFVMELVRGVPITEYCDQNHLTPRGRLQLFATVCHSVQHAHQKGLIHRDLKPSNVLVSRHDTTPIVKIIDFGVAKALGQSLTEKTLFTGIAQMIGTPMYMSPEQAGMSDLDVDTRSDIYSLGVLLYELLTGTTPFDKERLKSIGFDEMRRIIREDEPPRPSHRVSTLNAEASSTISQQRSLDGRHLGRVLRGELDWIVMKALEKDRSRRYESASALAADIQRYLSDEPVLACPPTTMYRFQKFARKHKPALATAAAIAACLILGTTVSAWQAVRATTAEAQANANEAQAKQAAAAETKQRQRAEANEQKATAQRDEVKALNGQLRQTLYASNMNLAKSAWEAGNVGRVRELLALHRPKTGEADLRGFEWFYLYRLCHSDLLTLNGDGGTFSPDGKRLAIASKGNAEIVDVETGKVLVTLKGGRGVTFSPDGKRVATGVWHAEGEIKLCDAETGQELLTFKGHTGYVNGTDFSPDGKHLASISNRWDGQQEKYVPGEMKVWDAETGRELLSIMGGGSSVAYSPDGKRLASLLDDAVKVWDAETYQELLSLKGGTRGVAFSRDGKRLASGRQVWDAQTGKVLLSLDGAQSVAFSPDGKRLATAWYDEPVKVRDAQTGQELLAFKGHTGWVTNVVFSPDGKRLASRSLDGTVKVWDTTASQEARTISGDNSRVRSVSFSPDGKRVAFGTNGAWDNTKKVLVDSEVKVCDAQTGQELISLKGHTSWINSIAYGPDGKRLASASSDQTVRVWDTQSGREHLTFKGHTAEVVSVVYSPDGKRLASCSSRPSAYSSPRDRGEPGEVKVWDAESGQELLTLKGHGRFVNCVAFSPDGQRLAALCRDQAVKVWDLQTGREILTLKVFVSAGGCIAFSPDGTRLAASNTSSRRSSSDSGEIHDVKVWDTQSGEEFFTLKGHSQRVHSVVFSPDGKRLATGSGGGPPSLLELKMWDALTGQELLTLAGNSRLPNDLSFSPDGHRLAGKGRDGTLKIWDATPLPE